MSFGLGAQGGRVLGRVTVGFGRRASGKCSISGHQGLRIILPSYNATDVEGAGYAGLECTVWQPAPEHSFRAEGTSSFWLMEVLT